MAGAGGQGTALVVDHEGSVAVVDLVAQIESERRRLDVLVNDIFGGDRYAGELARRSRHDAGVRDLGVTDLRRPRARRPRQDRHVAQFGGQVLTARQLADRYGVTDVDGPRPDPWGYIAAYGMEDQSGRNVERFR